MNKRSIYTRTFLMNALIVMFSFIILSGVFLFTNYQVQYREAERKLDNVGQELVRSISAYCYGSWDLSSLEMRIFIASVGAGSQMDILLTDTDGVIVSCSDREFACPHLNKQISTEIIGEMTQDGRSRRTNLGGIYEQKRIILCLPVRETDGLRENDNQTVIGYAFFSTLQTVMPTLWQEHSGLFLMLAVVVMLLTFVASYFSARHQSEPIMEMAAAANRFARGDYDARVQYDGVVYEIDALANAFNKMADAVQRSENNRREFVANVSHELKTPMTSIAGFADGLLDGTIPREQQDEYLGIISSETRRLSRLVRSMLDMSQLQAKETGEVLAKSFDLCEVIRLALLSLEHKITDKGLDVDASIPEEAIVVRGEQDAINQVVYNLIDNAAKFAPGGSVLRIAVWKQGAKAYVSVENDGDTISPEELPLIFDRFHKTDKSRSRDRDGVGLGLYIVKTILDNHNEDIFVTSKNGVTRFTFTMTLYKE